MTNILPVFINTHPLYVHSRLLYLGYKPVLLTKQSINTIDFSDTKVVLILLSLIDIHLLVDKSITHKLDSVKLVIVPNVSELNYFKDTFSFAIKKKSHLKKDAHFEPYPIDITKLPKIDIEITAKMNLNNKKFISVLKIKRNILSKLFTN